MGLRSFLFKKRSYTPVPIVIAVIYYSEPYKPFWVYGVFLIFLGEIIRFSAVRYAGGRTRTTNVGARLLCTSGPYSRTRNPLYIGNLFIYSGIIFFAGGIFMVELLTFVIIYFIFQYSMIISLEEEKLFFLFGKSYLLYKNNVPRLIPLLTPWNGESKLTPASIPKTIRTERRTLQNIFLLIFIIVSKPHIIRFIL